MLGTHQSNQQEFKNLSPDSSLGHLSERSDHDKSKSEQPMPGQSMPDELPPNRENLCGHSPSQPKKSRLPKRDLTKGASSKNAAYQAALPIDSLDSSDTWQDQDWRERDWVDDDEALTSEKVKLDSNEPRDEPSDEELAELGLTEDDLSAEGIQTEYDQGMAQARQVWLNALSELAMSMPPATYHTWMRDTQVIGYEDGEFIIGVPNAYACDWIKNRLRNQIKRTLIRLTKHSVQVTFRVATSPLDEQVSAESAPLYHQADQEKGSSPKSRALETPQHSYPNQQKSIDSSLSDSNHSQSDAQASKLQNNFQDNGASSKGRYSNEQNDQNISIKLNEYHTFNTFVVGNHNRMAHAAAEAISDRPGASFNPLFVYGGVGLGKTHLLHAIGNRALQKGFRILYCTSEQFTNELILAIRSQSTEHFRSKYRQVDILLIDDIQFIAGKESTQEEFFHTFNHLHAAGRQVILSSDRPPKALPTLEERLRSRFEGGLQTDISRPDFETRVAILQSKADTIGMAVEPAALMLIAERVDSNVRELEGALNRIALQAKLFSNKLDVALTESVLKNLAPERTLRTPAAIIEMVADHYHLTIEDIKGRSRTKDIAHARQIIMYLLREENAMSLPSIGDHLGGRDHSTVRHGVEKVSQDIESNESVRHQIMTLREKIYAAPGF